MLACCILGLARIIKYIPAFATAAAGAILPESLHSGLLHELPPQIVLDEGSPAELGEALPLQLGDLLVLRLVERLVKEG